jgi:hypothetical protein
MATNAAIKIANDSPLCESHIPIDVTPGFDDLVMSGARSQAMSQRAITASLASPLSTTHPVLIRAAAPEVMAMAVDARPVPQPQPLPPARVVRHRRPAMPWEEIGTWTLTAIFVVVVGWHLLHLQLALAHH